MKEADGGARGGRTVVKARRGSSPQAQSTGAPGARAGDGRTAQMAQHLSEDTNKVEMVKAMGHRAGRGQTTDGKGRRGWGRAWCIGAAVRGRRR